MAITKAVADRRWRQVRLLIQLSYDINSRDNNGNTPLIQTTLIDDEKKAVVVARYLLRCGAKIAVTDKQGRNALIHACRSEREQLIALFLQDNDYDLNHADCYGNTALIYSAITGNVMILNKLLAVMKKYKISVDKANHNGITALIAASQNGHILCSRILVSVGKASIGARDNQHFRTAKEWENTSTSRDLASKSPLFQLLSASRNSLSSSNSGNSVSSSQSAKPPSYRRRPRSAVDFNRIKVNEDVDMKKKLRGGSAGSNRRRVSDGISSANTTTTLLSQSNTLRSNSSKALMVTPFTKLMLLYQAQCSPAYKIGVRQRLEEKVSERSQSPISLSDKENSESTHESGVTSSKRRISFGRLVGGVSRSRRDSNNFSKIAKKALALSRSDSFSKVEADMANSNKNKNSHDVEMKIRSISNADTRRLHDKIEGDKARMKAKTTVTFHIPRKSIDDQFNQDEQNEKNSKQHDSELTNPNDENSLDGNSYTRSSSNSTSSISKSVVSSTNQNSNLLSIETTISNSSSLDQEDFDQINKDNDKNGVEMRSSKVSSEHNIDNTANNHRLTASKVDRQTIAIMVEENFGRFLDITSDTYMAASQFSSKFKQLKSRSQARFPTVIEDEELVA